MLETMQALAEPTRFSILRMIRWEEMSAGEIAGRFKKITRPAVSQHLGVLRKAGLVTERRAGTSRMYSLRPEGFAQIKILLEDFWDPRLAKLKSLAEKDEKQRRRKK